MGLVASGSRDPASRADPLSDAFVFGVTRSCVSQRISFTASEL